MGCIWSGHGSRASLYRVEVALWARLTLQSVLAAARKLNMVQADTGDQGSSTVFSWDKLERPDAKDFVFRDINEDIRVKPQGSVQSCAGQCCCDCNRQSTTLLPADLFGVSSLSLKTARYPCSIEQVSAHNTVTLQIRLGLCWLQGCSIFLFDTSAAVTIDDCTDCRILVGPVDGRYQTCSNNIHTTQSCKNGCLVCSLFLRDCQSCVVIAACHQFRYGILPTLGSVLGKHAFGFDSHTVSDSRTRD